MAQFLGHCYAAHSITNAPWQTWTQSWSGDLYNNDN